MSIIIAGRKFWTVIIIISIIFLNACDPSRVILFNNSMKSDMLVCGSKKIELLIKKGMSGSDMLIVNGVSQQDTFGIKRFFINGNDLSGEVQKEDGSNLFYVKGVRFNKSDTLKVLFLFNNCEFERNYLLGNTKNLR